MNDHGTPVRHAGTTSLVDLLDRVIDRGAVISGDVVIALAGVDLVRLDLRLLLTAVDTGVGGHQRDGEAGRTAGADSHRHGDTDRRW